MLLKKSKRFFTDEEVERQMFVLMACGIAYNATNDKQLRRKIKLRLCLYGMKDKDLTKVASSRFKGMSNEERTAFFEKAKTLNAEALPPEVSIT